MKITDPLNYCFLISLLLFLRGIVVMSITQFLLSLYFLKLLEPCGGGQYAITTSKRMVAKILHMDRELLKAVDAKVKAFQHITMIYQKTTAFQVGQQMADVKKAYKRILTLRDLADDSNVPFKYDNYLTWQTNEVSGPGKPMGNVQRMKFVIEAQQKAMQIDRLLEMIEEEEWRNRDRSERAELLQAKQRRNNGRSKINLNDFLHHTKNSDKKRLRTEMQKITKAKVTPDVNFQKHPDDGFDTD